MLVAVEDQVAVHPARHRNARCLYGPLASRREQAGSSHRRSLLLGFDGDAREWQGVGQNSRDLRRSWPVSLSTVASSTTSKAFYPRKDCFVQLVHKIGYFLSNGVGFFRLRPSPSNSDTVSEVWIRDSYPSFACIFCIASAAAAAF